MFLLARPFSSLISGLVIVCTLPDPAALEQCVDFVRGGAAEVARYGMLQAAGRHRKLERFLMGGERLKAVDQPGSKGIAGTDAIHDVRDLVRAAHHERLSVIQACRPAVVRRALGFPQSDGDRFQIRIFAQHLGSQLLVLRAIKLAGVNVHFGLDAERHLHVFFVGDGDIDILHQLAHHFSRRLSPLPKILAVVKIAGDRDSLLPRLLHRLQRQIGSRTADRGSYAGDVKPAGILQARGPI